MYVNNVNNFNSTMVRLKVFLQIAITQIKQFQFHYGTIKRWQTLSSICLAWVFQFHYGTIKRICWRDNDYRLFDFNSTMVRLKGFCYIIYPCSPSFQFHYGTIKSTVMTNWWIQLYHFNSTMVRLKDVLTAGFPCQPFSHFNSTMVRLKDWAHLMRCCLILNFNSTMVRLKVIGHAVALNVRPFQFHYGTIKRTPQTQGLKVCNDFNSTMVRLKEIWQWVQTWIEGNFNSTMVRLKASSPDSARFFNSISIPLWYD